jgi:phosphatidylinositol alpha-1,6-mannosyltransferase
LRDLAGVHPNLIYLIAGTGGDQTRLEELAHDTGAANIVQFLGFVSDENLPDLYRASDLYVMPSHGEGFGIAFVEAMACGTLALGLDQGGAGDALRNGELGIAVREADFPNALRTSLDTATSKISDISERTNNIFARDQFTCRVKSEIKWLMQN